MILFYTRPDGAFVAGDTRTGITSYAYPTSHHAQAARTRAAQTAARMLAEEMNRSRIPEANGQRERAFKRDAELLAELRQKGSQATFGAPRSPRTMHT